MTISKIRKSNFVTNFIQNYFDELDSGSSEKHKLLHAIAFTHEQRIIDFNKKINKCKKRIKKLGFEQLVYETIYDYQSINKEDYSQCKEYYERTKRNFENNFWHYTNSFTPITDHYEIEKANLTTDELERAFWAKNSYLYNAEQLSLHEALNLEIDLYKTIEGIIEENEGMDEYYFDVDLIIKYKFQSEAVWTLATLTKLYYLIENLYSLNYSIEIFNNPIIKTKEIEFANFGFNELKLVKPLSRESKAKLIYLIDQSSIPKKIAYFKFLDFLDHLEKNIFDSKRKMNDEVAKWFKTNSRFIKGNISVLEPKSIEDRKRYTAWQHIEEVKKEYKTIN